LNAPLYSLANQYSSFVCNSTSGLPVAYLKIENQKSVRTAKISVKMPLGNMDDLHFENSTKKIDEFSKFFILKTFGTSVQNIPTSKSRINTLTSGWFWGFSAKKTPKRTWLCA